VGDEHGRHKDRSGGSNGPDAGGDEAIFDIGTIWLTHAI
jgi:hypothetical protein